MVSMDHIGSTIGDVTEFELYVWTTMARHSVTSPILNGIHDHIGSTPGDVSEFELYAWTTLGRHPVTSPNLKGMRGVVRGVVPQF